MPTGLPKLAGLFLFAGVWVAGDLPVAAAEGGLLSLPAPVKKIEDLKLKYEAFTFVRIQYTSRGRLGRADWATDYPDAELNLSHRIKSVATGLKVEMEGKVLKLTSPELKTYPFIYMSEGGSAVFTEDEVKGLREYLSNGGFLMVDDFWGVREWESLAEQMKRVFSDLAPVELELDHPIFNCFYELKEKPQVPSVHFAIVNRNTGITWEREDAKGAHYRGLVDKKGRLMAVFCHNTDLADGWERENEDPYYTKEFSMKKAYPMGINIVLYALSR